MPNGHSRHFQPIAIGPATEQEILKTLDLTCKPRIGSPRSSCKSGLLRTAVAVRSVESLLEKPLGWSGRPALQPGGCRSERTVSRPTRAPNVTVGVRLERLALKEWVRVLFRMSALARDANATSSGITLTNSLRGMVCRDIEAVPRSINAELSSSEQLPRRTSRTFFHRYGLTGETPRRFHRVRHEVAAFCWP